MKIPTLTLALVWLFGSHATAVETSSFGPGGCVTTWLDAKTKSCVVRTACAQQASSFSSYALRLVCVGNDGGRVLHSFQEGGFELEETFDTHITCSRCAPGDDVTPAAPAAPQSPGATSGTALVTVNATELQGIEEEVKLLKSSMVNMAKVVSQLKLEVAESHGTLRGTAPAVTAVPAAAVTAVPAAPAVVMAAVAPHAVPNATSAQPAFHVPATNAQPAFHVTNATLPVIPVAEAKTPPASNLPALNTSRGAVVATVTTQQPTAPAMVAGALSPLGATSQRVRPRGASFLGVTASSVQSAALQASVASAQKEAEQAAQQAEKDAEAIAAAEPSDAEPSSAEPSGAESVVQAALAADSHP